MISERSRLSPHALAALTIAVLATVRCVVRVRTPFGFAGTILAISELTEALFVPICGCAVALWLCRAAKQEIAESEGSLVGQSWIVAARLLAIGALAMTVISTVVTLLLLEVVNEGVISYVR